jgi:hypothetical protein
VRSISSEIFENISIRERQFVNRSKEDRKERASFLVFSDSTSLAIPNMPPDKKAEIASAKKASIRVKLPVV